MSINIQAPSVQDISITEIQQTGVTTKSPIEKDEVQKRLKSFVAAHAQPTAPSPDANQSNDKPKGVSGVSVSNTAGAPQVDATEQQQAVLVKGLGDVSPLKLNKQPGKAKTFERVYKTLFHNDSNFFEQDMVSLLNALRLKRKSLVDLAPNLSPEQKALRKYLLLETLKEHTDPFVTQDDQKEILVARNKILEDFGDFVTGTLGAYNAGIEKKFAGPSLKEFIRAFQVMEIHPNTTTATDLFNLYKAIKKDLQAGAPIEKLLLMQEGFIQVLAREKTQNPARITSTRHHIILSRIKQFGTIITIHALHTQFLKWGQKAGIQGLPNAVSMTETCLQLVFSNETLAGANALVAMASAVRSDRMPAKNAFVSNYCRSVLLHNSISNMYRNANQRKILVEHIERNTQLSAILSPTAR